MRAIHGFLGLVVVLAAGGGAWLLLGAGDAGAPEWSGDEASRPALGPAESTRSTEARAPPSAGTHGSGASPARIGVYDASEHFGTSRDDVLATLEARMPPLGQSGWGGRLLQSIAEHLFVRFDSKAALDAFRTLQPPDLPPQDVLHMPELLDLLTRLGFESIPQGGVLYVRRLVPAGAPGGPWPPR